MENLIPLSDLCRCEPPIRVDEAVAIGLTLLDSPPPGTDARPPFGPLTCDTVVLDEQGQVRATATASTAGVAEVAILMESLLDCTADRVPGALRYALARALHNVEAAPFASAMEFRDTLARFAPAACDATLVALHARARLSPPATPDAPTVPTARAERRVLGEGHFAMRRHLRTADERLYETQRGQRRSALSPRRALVRAAVPVLACVLAGVALVIAGERSDVAPAGPSGAVASSAAMGDIALPPTPPVTPPRTSTSGDVAARTSTSAARQRPVRTRASRAMQRTAPRTTAPRDAKRPESKGVRIRFVWDNPFN